MRLDSFARTLLSALFVALSILPHLARAEDRDITRIAKYVRLKGEPSKTTPKLLADPLGVTTNPFRRLQLVDTDTQVSYGFDVFYNEDHVVMIRRTKDFGVLWRVSRTGNIEKCIVFTPPSTAKVVPNGQYSLEFKDAKKILVDYVQGNP